MKCLHCCRVFVCVISPVAPLWQTFQDIVTEAQLIISLTVVDALQGDPHQLVWVPDDLLRALQYRGRLVLSSQVCASKLS